MTNIQLEQTAKEWDELIHVVLNLEELSLSRVQQLLKETYRILTVFHKRQEVPKAITKIFLNMDAFLYFTSMMEENEKGIGFYCWQELHFIVRALKKGFFDGKYPYEFPKLLVSDVVDTEFLFDLEADRIEGYVAAVRINKAKEF